MRKSIVLKTIFITGVLFFLISVADAGQSELEKCAARMNDYTAYFKEISVILIAEKDNRTVGGYMSILGDIAGHYADLISHITDLQRIRDMTEEPGFIRPQAH